MLLEKFMLVEFSATGFDAMQSTVFRMHTFDRIGNERIGAPFDPDGFEEFWRVDNQWHVKVWFVRNEGGAWGHYDWKMVRLVTPAGKEIKGKGNNKVPDDIMALLKAYLDSPRPKPGVQPEPR